MTTIGIIGHGRFGRLMAKYLSRDFKVYVSSSKMVTKKKNIIPSTLEKACLQDIIIPCVPISAMEDTLKKMKIFLKRGSLVMDVCSVKEYPVALMRRILPKSVQILGSHPMFGPDSASDSLAGRKIVLCRIRVRKELFSKIKKYLKRRNLIIIETTAKKHDEEISESLVLTHFIGRALIDVKAKRLNIDTEGYKRLMKILEVVKNDTLQLFYDMNHYNRCSATMRRRFINSLEKIDKRLRK
ncbi:prephenate dehydrogenase/arogenate dehydrogenase family protein [Candidatus Woesearchaeota archaeon]|nr:prephenate dehydrogenase/arogenate dehydrogenase family protein [Candidatus Woesearchaeota archaeon]